jgi:hypothetical protein
MAKALLAMILLALAVSCGGKKPPADATDTGDAADAADTAAGDTPAAAEPSCDGLDETKCKITAGCAWSDQSTCVVDKAMP